MFLHLQLPLSLDAERLELILLDDWALDGAVAVSHVLHDLDVANLLVDDAGGREEVGAELLGGCCCSVGLVFSDEGGKTLAHGAALDDAAGEGAELGVGLGDGRGVEGEVVDCNVLVLGGAGGGRVLGLVGGTDGGLAGVGVDVDDGLDLAVFIGLEEVMGGFGLGSRVAQGLGLARLKEFGKVVGWEGQREGMRYRHGTVLGEKI